MNTPFQTRFTTLHDGRPGIRGGLLVDVREPSPAELAGSDSSPLRAPSCHSCPSSGSPSNPCLEFVASNETLDRYHEILSVTGWRLEHYRRNPVFQNAHQYGDILFTLGRALVTEVRGGGTSAPGPHLFQRIEFAVDVNPMARIAYGLYKGKFLNAVSVGFIPLRWEDAPPTTSERGSGTRVERVPTGHSGGRDAVPSVPIISPFCTEAADCASPSPKPRRRYLEQELLEVSAVSIPANPDALALGLKAGAVEKADLRAALDLLRSLAAAGDPQFFRSPLAASNPSAGASEVRSNEAHWLQLAGVLRDILRRS
jgi:hypothetical protein